MTFMTGDDPMQRLWAPWRLAYVAAAKTPAPDDDCFICRGLAQTDDRSNLIAWRRTFTAVLLNRFPYNNGHLLLAPKAHKATPADLTPEEVLEMNDSLSRAITLLAEILHPEGYNIGLNLGRVAGAGLPGHLHWHLVPRWNGDTNFMPVLGDVKVIAQSLDGLYDLIVERLPR